jgi:hypothetical protein
MVVTGNKKNAGSRAGSKEIDLAEIPQEKVKISMCITFS